jgi:flagellar protein FlgJ
MVGVTSAPSNGGLPVSVVSRIRKASQDFEAMAIGQMLQPMFATVKPQGGMFGGGAAEEQWRPFLVDAYAKGMAKAGGIGLSQPVFEQMLRAQAAGDASSRQ